jgi:hypothetical protein
MQVILIDIQYPLPPPMAYPAEAICEITGKVFRYAKFSCVANAAEEFPPMYWTRDLT